MKVDLGATSFAGLDWFISALRSPRLHKFSYESIRFSVFIIGQEGLKFLFEPPYLRHLAAKGSTVPR
jgi:hypothetical protein